MLKDIFLYGTAWKEELTESCVEMALNAGCRSFDTANQRKHYFEEAVGRALKKGYDKGGLTREDLFIQTKFTFIDGQDHRLPYDPSLPIFEQVQQSFQSSLQHLHSQYIDSYILHGPSQYHGLSQEDWEAWRAMEDLHKQGLVKHIGVSNVSLEQLQKLQLNSTVKPSFVQNRCFASTKWDYDIRQFCKQNQITYQGFSLLTANWKFLGGNIERPSDRNIPHLIFSKPTEDPNTSSAKALNQLLEITKSTGKTIQQIIFRFCHQVGIVPIIGTRSQQHLIDDLNINDFALSNEQLQFIENIGILGEEPLH